MRIKHIDVWLEDGKVYQYVFKVPVDFELWSGLISESSTLQERKI